jgi:hypothetical protein
MINSVQLLRTFDQGFIRLLVMKLRIHMVLTGDPVSMKGTSIPGLYFGACLPQELLFPLDPTGCTLEWMPTCH